MVRSTLAGWVGEIAVLLKPLAGAIKGYVLSGQAIFAADMARVKKRLSQVVGYLTGTDEGIAEIEEINAKKGAEEADRQQKENHERDPPARIIPLRCVIV